jgi:hypothetical protein
MLTRLVVCFYHAIWRSSLIEFCCVLILLFYETSCGLPSAQLFIALINLCKFSFEPSGFNFKNYAIDTRLWTWEVAWRCSMFVGHLVKSACKLLTWKLFVYMQVTFLLLLYYIVKKSSKKRRCFTVCIHSIINTCHLYIYSIKISITKYI